jgi:type II secretory pathway pseudopilin PulG
MTGSKDQGFTRIEMVLLVAVAGIICVGAVPGLLRTNCPGNETSAVVSLKLTASAQVAYSAACGHGGYASSFVVLGTPPPGGPGFVPADLGSVVAPRKTGYNFTMGPGAGAAAGPTDCNGTATVTEYLAAGTPATGAAGSRSFAVNRSNTVWQLPGGVAPREPFGAPATPVQ